MTRNYDPRAEILWSGTDDWVSLAEAAAIVADERAAASEDIRSETLDILAGLLRADLIQAGEVMGGFRPWGVSPDDALSKLFERWTEPSQPLSPLDGTWFANTPAGDALAHELADAGLTSRPGDAN